ncbi:MAG: hypothetical protein RID15_16990 [Marinovum algicola]|jgi:hypothetical protein|uniref:Tat pathway signal sequence domain protein n=1 Tax=Marinovum algicola TaxID=42444 RepID=A0A975WDG0_9RHOB|nr:MULTISPECIES: hypothetical protein [Marinovum]MDD9739543.1 hypothetical protein [Marinovum sp. SP66]SEK01026.1 hypothetical protein SAMN04487940_11836 [Marinovum algicola]SLN44769.1 hypothetical protein MAA5396_02197 [Marinovum algicola]
MGLWPLKHLAPRGLALCAALMTATPVLAQEEQGAALSVELNALDSLEGACQMSFLIQNGHDADITQAVFEAVLFDSQGRVERLTLFDFGTLPAARPRVRQFVVPDLACEALGRVLFNGAETCTGAGLAEGACEDGLLLSSRTAVELLG